MTISLDDFRARGQGKSAEGLREGHVRELRERIAAGLRATAVMQDSNWNDFLARLEARIKACESVIANERNLQHLYTLTDHEKLRLSAIKVACFETQAQTLREVIELPRKLVDEGSEASERLAKMEAADTTP